MPQLPGLFVQRHEGSALVKILCWGIADKGDMCHPAVPVKSVIGSKGREFVHILVDAQPEDADGG